MDQSEELQKIQEELKSLHQELGTVARSLVSIKRRLLFSSLYGTVKFLVIAGSLVIGFLYLQPQVKSFVDVWETVKNSVLQVR